MAQSNPPQLLVTVYMATQNRMLQLRDAIASVLGQTYSNLELLVVDDASTDETAAVLADAARLDPRVRIFRRETIGGSAAARNMAIRAARGQFLVGLDDDDQMLPNRIEVLMSAYSDDYAFVCTPYYQDYGRWIRDGPIGTRLITLSQLLYSDAVGIQILTRTSRVLEVGLFDETMPAWVDYDLFTRLVMRFGPGLRCPIRTAIVRVDPRAARVTTSNRAAEGARLYYEKYKDLMDDAQRRSHRIMWNVIVKQRLNLREARLCWGRGTRARVVRTWIATNIPLATQLREAWWTLRWPRGRFRFMSARG
ncbi:MAG: glycosyltransferase, partial [Proteobacteria bacterium]|nr:glycosyltransferase [Pseudomonadota bacterium]